MKSTEDVTQRLEKAARIEALRQERLARDHILIHFEEDKPPRKLDKQSIFKTFYVLGKLSKEDQSEVAFYISADIEVESKAAQKALSEMGYEPNASDHDKHVKEIIDTCIRMREDFKKFIFDDQVVLGKLEPEELEMMRTGVFNTSVYLQRKAADAATEWRIQGVIHSSKRKPPAGASPSDVAFTPYDPIRSALMSAFADRGVTDPARVDAYLQQNLRPDKNPMPIFPFMDQNQPGNNTGKNTVELTDIVAPKSDSGVIVRPKLKLVENVGPQTSVDVTKPESQVTVVFDRSRQDDDDLLFTDPDDLAALSALAYEISTEEEPDNTAEKGFNPVLVP